VTIHLPKELETSIQAIVRSGRFASLDEAMSEAARLLLREHGQAQPANASDPAAAPAPDPVWGCMRDDSELMDEIVEDAYRQRRSETWRELDI
jgi:Arc/MetJ-type ribon-helix-helix transcriptional regulator